MMASLLVSHPHAAAVASALAAALEAQGRLALYATGIAAVPGSRSGRWLGWAAVRRPALANRFVAGLAPAHLRSLGLLETALRAGSAAARLVGAGVSTYDALFIGHDQAVAVMPWPRGVTAIYAYEDGALRTFQRARRRQIVRIWDLPLPHWGTLERIWQVESARWPGAMSARPPIEPDWKKRRKDAELSLADVISVASGFTRSSLEAVEFAKPIIATPYGFPVDQFPSKERPSAGPFTVLAVGTQDLRKGTPYLLEAWRRAGIKDGKLRLIGPMKLTPGFLARYQGLFEHIPHVPRAKLASEYQAADLLAFPTLGDGFGLVIQEAMCCATPVVTTPCGGGPECIKQGEDGWLIPPRDLDALVDVLRAAAADRDRLHRMGVAARRRAERWTWIDAGRMLVASLTAALR